MKRQALEEVEERAELTGHDEPDESRRYDADLRKKTRWSILWTAVRITSDQIFSFVVFVILARLLSPHEFGIFALAFAFHEIGRVIAITGMVQNIPRAKKLTPALVDTVFWTNLAMAFIVALAVLGLAPPIMTLIDQPEAIAPLQALGLVLPIAALGATHMSLRLREFGHKSLALRSLIGGTVGGAVAIAAAFAGWGIWSLVVQRFVTETANAATAWLSYKYTPGRNVSMAQVRVTWLFGFHLMTTQIIGMLPKRAMDMTLGWIIGAAAVGINRTALRTAELVMYGTTSPFTTVALQTMSRLQSDTQELIKAYRWMLTRSAALSLPALVGFGVLAPDAVPAIYGHKWVEAGQLAQIFALLAVPYSLNSFASPILIALGRGSALQTLALGQLVATVVFAAVSAPFGLTVVAWVWVLRSYLLALPFQMWFLRRAAGIRPRDSLSAIAPPLAASLIMGAAVWLLMALMRPYFSMPLAAVFICVAAGMLIYAIAIYAISAQARQMIAYRLKVLREKRRKK
jgi:O-antigen/teichoic acid export membrane protein